MARRSGSRLSDHGRAALEEIEERQRAWVVIPVADSQEVEGLVVVRAPRFQGRLGRGLVKTLKRDQEFNLHLDEFGSRAWRLFDGERTVGEIADVLADEAGDEPALALARLLMFLRRLKSGGVVRVVTIERMETQD
jgi:uncharacterized protein with GYD domain